MKLRNGKGERKRGHHSFLLRFRPAPGNPAHPRAHPRTCSRSHFPTFAHSRLPRPPRIPKPGPRNPIPKFSLDFPRSCVSIKYGSQAARTHHHPRPCATRSRATPPRPRAPDRIPARTADPSPGPGRARPKGTDRNESSTQRSHHVNQPRPKPHIVPPPCIVSSSRLLIFPFFHLPIFPSSPPRRHGD